MSSIWHWFLCDLFGHREKILYWRSVSRWGGVICTRCGCPHNGVLRSLPQGFAVADDDQIHLRVLARCEDGNTPWALQRWKPSCAGLLEPVLLHPYRMRG